MMWETRELPERLVDRQPNQVDVQISMGEAQNLIRSGGYEKSFGMFPGEHYRKKRGHGCYHLRVYQGRAYLHWDRWDPRRSPGLHFFETPALWMPAAVVGTLLFFAISER